MVWRNYFWRIGSYVTFFCGIFIEFSLVIRKLLPAKTAIETDSITMEGNIETVNKSLRESGFTDIVVSKIDDEEIVCENSFKFPRF